METPNSYRPVLVTFTNGDEATFSIIERPWKFANFLCVVEEGNVNEDGDDDVTYLCDVRSWKWADMAATL
jgi:hypothetical protein